MATVAATHALAQTPASAAPADGVYDMIVGTYTSGKSEGLYVYRFDTKTGDATLVSVAKTVNPSWLVVSRDNRHVYAVNELPGDNGPATQRGGVSAFSFDPQSGQLAFVNRVSSQGNDPCYLSLSPDGHSLFVANYSVAADPGSSVSGSTTASQNLTQLVTGQPQTSKRIDPFYLLMRLPGTDQMSFLMLRPFVPFAESISNERQTLTSFMVATSDPDDYGKLVVYEMPTGQEINGPVLANSQILANDAIARQLTLLNQQGSHAPPLPVGAMRDDDDPEADFEAQKAFTPWTSAWNVTGMPAVSLPLHWTDDGLPVGVMLAARPAEEEVLLALSAQVEAADPWHDRRPPGW